MANTSIEHGTQIGASNTVNARFVIKHRSQWQNALRANCCCYARSLSHSLCVFVRLKFVWWNSIRPKMTVKLVFIFGHKWLRAFGCYLDRPKTKWHFKLITLYLGNSCDFWFATFALSLSHFHSFALLLTPHTYALQWILLFAMNSKAHTHTHTHSVCMKRRRATERRKKKQHNNSRYTLTRAHTKLPAITTTTTIVAPTKRLSWSCTHGLWASIEHGVEHRMRISTTTKK